MRNAQVSQVYAGAEQFQHKFKEQFQSQKSVQVLERLARRGATARITSWPITSLWLSGPPRLTLTAASACRGGSSMAPWPHPPCLHIKVRLVTVRHPSSRVGPLFLQHIPAAQPAAPTSRCPGMHPTHLAAPRPACSPAVRAS